MRPQRTFGKIRNETAGAGPAQSGAAGFIPTSSRPAVQRYPWKTNIVTTVFWAGEQAGGNNPVPNYKSAWDFNWTSNYGGYDNPDASGTT